MKKNFKITSLTAAALAAFILSSANLDNNVKADNVTGKTTTSEKSQSPEDQAKANVVSAQKNVDTAQKDVDSSKANLDKAKSDAVEPNKAYDDQTAKTKEANKNAENKKNTLDAANKKQSAAQKLADEATPDAINKARQDVADKNSEIAQKQQDVKDAQAKTSDAQKNVDNANADVNAKNDALIKAQNAKSDADKHVKDIENVMNDTNFDKVSRTKAKSEAIVKQDNIDIEKNDIDIQNGKTKVAFANKKQVDARKQQEITNLSAQKAEQEYKTKETISFQAENDAKKKKDELNNLNSQKKQIDDLIREQNKNNIIVHDLALYRKAYADFMNGNLTVADKTYLDRAIKDNKYIHSAKDEQRKVDVNNLTDDQLKEISLFTAYLLNQLRTQFGLAPNDIVTNGSIQFAKKVTQAYRDDQWSIIEKQDHDCAKINNLAKDMGLEQSLDNDNSQLYENAGEDASSDNSNIPLTMDGVKAFVFDQINSMIFGSGSQYEFDHARGMLGTEYESSNIIAENNKSEIQEEVNSLKEDLIDDPHNSDYDFSLYRNLVHAQQFLKKMKSSSFYTEQDIYKQKQEIENLNQQISKKKSRLEQLEEKLKGDNSYSHYIGVDLAYLLFPNTKTPYRIQVHFESGMTQKSIVDSSKFNTTVIPSYSNQAQALQNKIDKADQESKLLNSKVSLAKQETTKYKSIFEKANKDAEKANISWKNANKEYATAQAELQVAINHEQELQRKYSLDLAIQTSAQESYAAFERTHTELMKRYNAAVSSQNAAEQNVKDATKALADAETNLANAQKAQSDLKGDIANKQKLVEKAQGELTSLQARQTLLEGAHQALADAKQTAQQAQNEYDTAKKAADDTKAQLDALKTAKDTADAKVKTAQDKYDQAKVKLSDAQAKLAHAKQVLYDLEHPAIYVDNSSEEKPVEEVVKTSTNDNEGEEATPVIKKSTSVKIEFIHNSYVYTINGKIVKRHGKRYLIRKGHKAVALNNAKVVKINGKKFYQIAKNEYVKVVNTMTEARKTNVRAIIKGRKNQKVRTYSSVGKFSHHYVYGKRSYKFTSKKNIKGKTYYKLSGKDEWILASKLIWKN